MWFSSSVCEPSLLGLSSPHRQEAEGWMGHRDQAVTPPNTPSNTPTAHNTPNIPCKNPQHPPHRLQYVPTPPTTTPMLPTPAQPPTTPNTSTACHAPQHPM
ncbi:peptidase S1 [Platysternon megacephalum]|uniref:Peptidase S1 n=1 Tax=Platysternon megacephalum TaxID=55544 RepID=A0A4D9DH61_9SAUR|nr:peptidase S1 [Platysternon megacephalum]